VLDVVRDRLVDKLGPERIYLFGSRAYGIPRSDSDLDLVLVFPSSANGVNELGIKARGIIGDIGCGVDVLVYTSDVFDRRSGWSANFEHTVRNKGILLHGVDGMRFAREWIDKAAKDWAAALILINEKPPLLDSGAFHCQQAAEKVLKAYLVQMNDPFEKVHDLRLLCDRAAKFDGRFQDLREEAATLNRYAVLLRYPGEPDPTAEEANSALAMLQHIWSFVMERLPKDLQCEAPMTSREKP
jgi:HEPN domain-containing protein/predicted nucleotidyltransferase